MIYRYSKFLITFGNISPRKNNFLMWLGFKTSDCKHWRKVNFYSHVSLRYMAGLYVAGFGATAKGHFQACALCQFFGAFSLPAAVAEVAITICLKFPNVCHVRWSGIDTYSKCKLPNSRWYFHLATSNTFGMSRTR